MHGYPHAITIRYLKKKINKETKEIVKIEIQKNHG